MDDKDPIKAAVERNALRRMFTKDELSEMGVGSIKTIDRMIADGRIPAPFRIGKRSLRWSREVIEKWIAGGCKPVAASKSRR